MVRAEKIILTMIFAMFFALPIGASADDFVNPYENYANETNIPRAIPVDESTLGNTASGVTNGVGNAIGGVASGVGNAVNGVAQPVAGAVSSVVGGVGSAVGGVVQPITGAVSNVVGGVGNAVNGVVQPVTGAVSNVIGGVSNAIGGALGGILGGSGGGNAQPTATAKTFANMKSIDQICKFTVDTDEGINVISMSVNCFENIFLGIVEEKLAGMTDFMSDAVFAALVLYVIFYGIKTSSGMITEQRARGEFFMHALKIAFVSWMVMSYGIIELWYLTLDIYNGLLDLVFIPTDMANCQIASKSVPDLWKSMDCILTEFIGWNAQNGSGKFEVPLLFGMFTSALNSGAGGAFIAMLVFLSILTLVTALMRVAFVYILSMMGLILAFMISPIIIPLMLFPQTKQMFDGWWKLIVSMVLQPVILFAYMSFMLSIFVEIIDGPEGLKAIYAQAKPHYYVAGLQTRGTDTGITSLFSMFKDNPKEGGILIESKLVFNLLSVFVVAYLLSSFTKFVGDMAVELSGNALSPNLSSMTPSILNKGL